MFINKANLAVVFTAFKAAFSKGFEAPSHFEEIATIVPSTTKEEKYAWLGQFPSLREWVGDRQIQSLALHDYAIKNKTYESTVGIPREDLEDDTYGVFTPLFQEMGQAAKVHPDQLVFALLAAGFTTVCYDGQYFFDTDHPVAGASVSNLQAGAGKPWFLLDTSRALKPIIYQKRRDYAFTKMFDIEDERVFMAKEFRAGVDGRGNVGFGFWQMAFASKAALDGDNFNDAYAAMMAFKSEDSGRPLGIKPTLLVVGPSNRAAALSIVATERLGNGASNPNYQVVKVLVCPWLE